MLQDLERGALTEVDVINGGVVVTAGRLGVPAPGNAAVVDFVHACERGEQNPSRAAFARIADALGVDR
jgi:2-dehydropantoate 2-reductase